MAEVPIPTPGGPQSSPLPISADIAKRFLEYQVQGGANPKQAFEALLQKFQSGEFIPYDPPAPQGVISRTASGFKEGYNQPLVNTGADTANQFYTDVGGPFAPQLKTVGDVLQRVGGGIVGAVKSSGIPEFIGKAADVAEGIPQVGPEIQALRGVPSVARVASDATQAARADVRIPAALQFAARYTQGRSSYPLTFETSLDQLAYVAGTSKNRAYRDLLVKQLGLTNKEVDEFTAQTVADVKAAAKGQERGAPISIPRSNMADNIMKARADQGGAATSQAPFSAPAIKLSKAQQQALELRQALSRKRAPKL